MEDKLTLKQIAFEPPNAGNDYVTLYGLDEKGAVWYWDGQIWLPLPMITRRP
jgi:hypothetical protein